MTISQLKLTNLRNIAEADLGLSTEFNLFYGENGSGKTSLLEAIHLLAMRRSFRTHLSTKLINNAEKLFTVFGKIGRSTIGIEKSSQGPIMVKYDGDSGASMAEIARIIPTKLIYTQGFQLLDSGPKIRRQFMDWGLFHVELEFFGHWQKFQAALEQRNALLKQTMDHSQLRVWDDILEENANIIDSMRNSYMERFLPIFNDLAAKMLNTPIQISYERGWS